MRQKIIAANWKMNGCVETVTSLMQEVCQLLPNPLSMNCVILPPLIYLPLVSHLLSRQDILLGAQNSYPLDGGAVTGEVSTAMLNDYSCRYVLVGHSERRRIIGETEKFIAEKFHHVKDHDIIPILCIGETLEERENGETEAVLMRQLSSVVKGVNTFSQCVIAYEPVWAIGSGHAATPEQIQLTHAFIRSCVATYNQQDACDVPIIYGGSVTASNAAMIFALADVDGGLIGGASLDARQFVEIVKCINLF